MGTRNCTICKVGNKTWDELYRTICSLCFGYTRFYNTKRNLEFYGLPKQTVNSCIKDLKDKNYVLLQANPQDKREKIVTLTEPGILFSKDKLDSLFRIEEFICRNISSENFVQAIETRELFNTLFEKEMERD